MRARGEDKYSVRIERYVTDNPQCQKMDIVRDLGIVKNTVTITLNRLRAIGRVRKIDDAVEVNGRIFQVTLWEPGIEEGIAKKEWREGMPKRKFVTTWAPLAESDQLFSLFFKNHNKEIPQDETAFAS